MMQRAVERDLEIIGEALNQLERDAPDVAALLPDLAEAVGLRKRIAHGYDTIESERVWETAVDHLPGHHGAVRSALAETGP